MSILDNVLSRKAVKDQLFMGTLQTDSAGLAMLVNASTLTNIGDRLVPALRFAGLPATYSRKVFHQGNRCILWPSHCCELFCTLACSLAKLRVLTLIS